MAVNIAINGFGRIGKSFLRSVLQDDVAKQHLNVVAINVGPRPHPNLEHFFTYDSTFGTFRAGDAFKNIQIFNEADPKNLPWSKLGVDWVVEASGKFTSKAAASAHLEAGCKKVLITAPATDEDVTIVPGVNDIAYNPAAHHIISLGSCTTNCFAPIIKVLKEKFSLQQGFMTTVHAYTNNQALLDSQHKDLRRGRAAATNIIPTSTGAAKVIIKLFPELEGKIQAAALRVPVPTVSLVDFAFTAGNGISVEAINDAFQAASESDLKGVLHVTKEPLVSSDFIGSPYSCVIDSLLTKAGDSMGQVFGWYDNEFGYGCRVRDFLQSVG